jgi:o-succinylbenzoate synthase
VSRAPRADRDPLVLGPAAALIETVSTIAPAPLARLRVDVVAVPFRTPVQTARGAWTTRRSILLTLRDADGAHGTGEIAPAPGEEAEAIGVVASLARSLDGLTPGEALAAIDADRTADATADPSREVALASAIGAGIETALLDLVGRRAGLSVAALLAGVSGREEPRGRVAVSALVSASGAEEASADAAVEVARGARCVKLKVGGEPDLAAFIRRIRAVRAAVGDDVELRLDANGWWSVADAIDRLRALLPYRIAYVEQPVASVADLAALRRAVHVPIAADEVVGGAASARRLIDAGAADVLVVKPARVGGAVETLRIAALAFDAGIPIVLSTFYETGIGLAAALHIAAALPGEDVAHGIATASVFASDLLVRSPVRAADALLLPEAAGLGVELDVNVVAEFRESGRGEP